PPDFSAVERTLYRVLLCDVVLPLVRPPPFRLILQGYPPAFLPVRLQYNTPYRIIARSFFTKNSEPPQTHKKAGSLMRSGLKS
ncbi:MAG: hypothetical protein JXJ17_19110, partial [Anaerolineae bacterium]|nr:hypothetical protein [Anaerolineae bacterium]